MPKKTLLIIFTYKYPFEPPTEQFLDDELPYLLKEDIDVLVTFGAGDIDRFTGAITELLASQS